MVADQLPLGRLSDGSACHHEGQTSTYCTRCWMNLFEASHPPADETVSVSRLHRSHSLLWVVGATIAIAVLGLFAGFFLTAEFSDPSPIIFAELGNAS
jgi:hypothetical protein